MGRILIVVTTMALGLGSIAGPHALTDDVPGLGSNPDGTEETDLLEPAEVHASGAISRIRKAEQAWEHAAKRLDADLGRLTRTLEPTLAPSATSVPDVIGLMEHDFAGLSDAVVELSEAHAELIAAHADAKEPLQRLAGLYLEWSESDGAGPGESYALIAEHWAAESDRAAQRGKQLQQAVDAQVVEDVAAWVTFLRRLKVSLATNGQTFEGTTRGDALLAQLSNGLARVSRFKANLDRAYNAGADATGLEPSPHASGTSAPPTPVPRPRPAMCAKVFVKEQGLAMNRDPIELIRRLARAAQQANHTLRGGQTFVIVRVHEVERTVMPIVEAELTETGGSLKLEPQGFYSPHYDCDYVLPAWIDIPDGMAFPEAILEAIDAARERSKRLDEGTATQLSP